MGHLDGADLKPFFEPGSVAAIGSMREAFGTARWLIRNMRHAGFKGPIHPVNPDPAKYGEVFGFRVCASVTDAPGPVDLAVIVAPPDTIPETLEQCAAKGVKAAVVLSEGFAEADAAGVELQDRLTRIARRTGVRIIGPNTFGVVNSANGLSTIAPYMDQDPLAAGGVAFCSQTGSTGPHQMPLGDWAYPISKMCDLGNKCDVDEADVLEYLAGDPDTKVVAMHVEGVKDAGRFLAAARRLVARKPLVIMKSGRTEAGARASSSHTGSLAGSDEVHDGAFRQLGAIRVRTWQELWEVPKTLVYQPLPKGNRFAFVTFTGGQGVIAADAAAQAGLEVARFTPGTVRKMKDVFPRLGGNPVDVGPAMSDSRSQSSSNPYSALERAMALTLGDANVDCATLTFSTGNQVVPLYPMVVDMFERLTKDCGKTVNIWIYGTGLSACHELARLLHARGIPAYFDLDTAISSLGYAARYARSRLA